MRLHARHSEPRDLEVALLRKGVGALEAGRHACVDCGRTPLVGEVVYRFVAGTRHRTALVCALCRPQHRTEPEGAELVRHSERGQTVRRLRPAA
jgi:hypothetical protein